MKRTTLLLILGVIIAIGGLLAWGYYNAPTPTTIDSESIRPLSPTSSVIRKQQVFIPDDVADTGTATPQY